MQYGRSIYYKSLCVFYKGNVQPFVLRFRSSCYVFYKKIILPLLSIVIATHLEADIFQDFGGKIRLS